MKLKKTQIALGLATATLSMAGALVSPQAVADAKVEALEAQVNQMSEMLQQMQSELSRVRDAASRSAADTAKVQELDEWAASVKANPISEKSKDNMVFFRGGYAHANDNRGGFSAVPAGGTLFAGGGAIGANGDPLVGNTVDKDAWYFGAGFDWSLSNDFFGLWDGTELFAELGIEYKEFNDMTNSVVTGQNVTTNQLNISAAPKVKFLKGSAFRPWLIPVGLDLNIISPPSGAVTVLNPGILFGAGADYNIWKNLYVGGDVRYHYSTDTVDGIDTDGVTAGGYLGIGF